MSGGVLEAALQAQLDAALAPVRSELRALRDDLAELRRVIPPPLRTVEEAAEALGVSISTVRRGVRDGTIPARRIGRSVRIDMSTLRPKGPEEIARLARAARTGRAA